MTGLDGLYGPTLLVARVYECTENRHDGRNDCVGCLVDLWILRNVFGGCLASSFQSAGKPCTTRANVLDCGQ